MASLLNLTKIRQLLLTLWTENNNIVQFIGTYISLVKNESTLGLYDASINKRYNRAYF